MDAWIGYCAFHLGEYERGMKVYKDILKKVKSTENSVEWLYLACCQFFLGEYEDAQKSAKRGPENALQNRILFHCADRLRDEYGVMNHHKRISEDIEDQLCLASMHYLRNHVQEATEIYKKLLVEERYLAFHHPIAGFY